MTDSSLSSCTYMGTRMVVLTSKDGGSSNHPREGLIAVLQEKQTSEEDANSEPTTEPPKIRIRLGTDSSIYRCDIPPNEVKISNEDKNRLVEILLQEKAVNAKNGPIQRLFQFSSDGELKLFLKQQRANDISKNVFRTVLEKEKSGISLLRFCADLGEVINTGMSRVIQLQEDLDSTKSNLQEWKENAKTFEAGVQKAQDKRLDATRRMFLENQQRQKKVIDDLKKQLKQGNSKSSTAPLAPDDWSAMKTEEILPESMVAKLAKGEKVYKDDERKSILTKDTKYSGLKEDKKAYADKRRAGAAKRRGRAKKSSSENDDEEKEEGDVQMKESDSEEESRPSRQRKKVSKRRRTSPETSSDDDRKPKAKTRKKATAVVADSDTDDSDDDDDDSAKKTPPKPISKPVKAKSSDDSSETDDGGDAKPVPKKVEASTKADSDSDSDSDSEDSLLAHLNKSPNKMTVTQEQPSDDDSATDDGNGHAAAARRTTNNDDSDSDDSDTDDGQDQKSGYALESNLLKNAKKVQVDDGSDSDF